MAATTVRGALRLSNGDAKVNPEIESERRKAEFNPEDVTYFLEGGQENTERRRALEATVFSDPAFKKQNLSFMTQEQRYTHSVGLTIKAIKKMRELDITDNQQQWWFKEAVHGSEETNLSLHSSMFLHCIYTQMTEDQQEIWLNAAFDYTVIGTYAQTEMGHGTYLRGLETTATYDPSTQEFVLHSPTLTSMKWWPGNLGKTVTHAVVAARLITQGKDHGTHMFMVQLRSMKDHTPLPGVELGDIGPKLGFNNIDNGYLRMDRVRIPRDHMCMKFSQVAPDGTYTAPPIAKLSYGSMVVIRSFLIDHVGVGLAKGAMIATRYSAVRRQSELIPGKPEPRILDYQSQQMKLFPQIASAFALLICGAQLKDRFLEYLAQTDEGNFSALPELHGTTAGVKAFTTEMASSGLEILRMSCGGHGFSAASGFPEIYSNVVAACTYEGENTVMHLQTARFLMKAVKQAMEGAKLTPFMSYITANPQERCPARNPNDFMNMEILRNTYRHRARSTVRHAAKCLEDEIRGGKSSHMAWNDNHLHLIAASKAHCHLFILDSFNRSIEGWEHQGPARTIMEQLVRFYGLHGILQNKGEFLVSGHLSVAQLDLVNKQYIALLEAIRPNAVALVDAFDIHDDRSGRSWDATTAMSTRTSTIGPSPLPSTKKMPIPVFWSGGGCIQFTHQAIPGGEPKQGPGEAVNIRRKNAKSEPIRWEVMMMVADSVKSDVRLTRFLCVC
ncbi:putative peroxisomal acyl-coenzyme A oxidase 1 isoform X3 [Apostichopus japonicus]|uniref:Acyl-coenzyme A oxidase n=1 Tax=Stichopus japonicus TaxID=307972 RepID=A0A2G8K9Q7_STIJA|nr:putative peroxisomal acyl-coenzyme A oxidase 1 isoform X3 [Apostichopus japonicus]